jgi:hypothetical protein
LDAVALTSAERRFLEELDARGVPYMIVGLTAALMQGANTVTIDIDLWFESTSDPRIPEAAKAAGGMFVSGFGMMPAKLAAPLDRFDVIFGMSGLAPFSDEYARAKAMLFEGIPTKVLPLDRVLTSKRAANRRKDQIVIPALEEALAAIEDDEKLKG